MEAGYDIEERTVKLNEMEKIDLSLKEDPNQMAFFPDGEFRSASDTQEVVDMVRVPLVGEEKGKVAVDAVVESMVGLPFGTMEKPSFFGLPMRIRWELWVQLMGWTLEGGVLEAGAIYGHVEVGRDGHYFDLQAEPSTKEIVSFEGQEAGFPRKKVYIYHQRNDVVRLEFRRKPDGVCVGYSNFPLKELKPNVPRCGWVKIKDPEKRDSKQRRLVVGKMHLGLMISQSVKAQVLLLLDTETKEILFFQGVETIEDLNPVFTSPSMTPFRWTMDSKKQSFAVYHGKVVVAILEVKTLQANTRAVTVKRDGEGVVGGFWQCTAHFEVGATEISIEGSWEGKVCNVSTKTATRFNIVNVHGEVVGHSEQRNSRDIKLSVDSPTLDPLTPVCLLLVATFVH